MSWGIPGREAEPEDVMRELLSYSRGMERVLEWLGRMEKASPPATRAERRALADARRAVRSAWTDDAMSYAREVRNGSAGPA